MSSSGVSSCTFKAYTHVYTPIQINKSLRIKFAHSRVVAGSTDDVSKSALGTSAKSAGILWALGPDVSEGPQPEEKSMSAIIHVLTFHM